MGGPAGALAGAVAGPALEQLAKEALGQWSRRGERAYEQAAKEAPDAKAKAVIDDMTKVAGFTETFLPGPYALAISPARYAVERGDWKAAA